MNLAANLWPIRPSFAMTLAGPAFHEFRQLFQNKLIFFPEAASKSAHLVDHLYFFISILSIFMTLLIGTLIVVFAIHYRRRPERKYKQGKNSVVWLEVFWSVVPLFFFLIMFVWGAKLYIHESTPPKDADEIFVVAKQWMWKFQHATGEREIDQLHVPTGRAIKLLMVSQDVIHSFFVPAFRIKMDVLPERYTVTWFEPTKPGVYHLFCAEFCGTQHSRMGGRVVVMSPQDYGKWLAERGSPESLVDSGRKLFHKFGCAACHQGQDANRAPDLEQLYGSKVILGDGTTVIADENYIRRSILNSNAQVVSGYDPIMPAYEGRLKESEIMAIMAYIKSIAGGSEGFNNHDQ